MIYEISEAQKIIASGIKPKLVDGLWYLGERRVYHTCTWPRNDTK